MTADELRSIQSPLKLRYRDDPASALITMKARGTLLPEQLACRLEPRDTRPEAGLHPAAGGDGSWACSGEILLDALVACAGVTVCAVSTAMGLNLRSGTIDAEGDADFRGTLGVERSVPVGISRVRLHIDLDSDASPDQLATLLKLTERYCVIYQTLQASPAVEAAITASGGEPASS